MHQMIPSVTHADFGTSTVTLPVPADITGPGWLKSVSEATFNQVPWLATRYVAASSPERGAPGGESATSTQSTVPQIAVVAPGTVQEIPTSLPDSSYTATISATGVTIECREPAGAIQALRALGQLRGTGGELPVGRLTDKPRFEYRGVHLDVGRHFFGVSFVKRLLRLMASLGFNVFHWHLTEDQGWRIPIGAYPELTRIGAFRTRADGSRYGGHYTKDEIRETVEYAGALGILVVPEIELPGHATAAIAAYPELSCRGEEIAVTNEWGIREDVFCAGNDLVFDFLGAVFDEVCDLFPSRLIHLGGDECPKVRWRECDKCNSRLVGEGLQDYEELQSYVIGRAAQMLAARGRKAIGWDEILEGGIPADALVMSWRGTSGGIAAAAAGHRVIMTPNSHCYLDYRQSDAPDAVGFSFADEHGRIPVTPIDKVYAFDPLADLEGASAANVIGGQANVWTEQMETEEIVESMIAPRILAMAEVLWAYPENRDFALFKPRAQAALALLDRMGWRYCEVSELS